METERLYFIDWLRFIAVIILIFFHTALIFSAQSNFPIKNNELSALFEELIFFVHSWRLALLFFISGVGTSIALQFKSIPNYLKERFKRLLIPLIFGILVVVPPQIYFERLSQGFAFESFGSFYLQSFSTGLYPYGNISWNHLWFIAYLLIYSVLSVPLLTLIKSYTSEWAEKIMRNGGVIFIAIPLAVITIFLKPHSLGIQNIVDDLAMFFFYWFVFLAGFAISQKKYWQFENKLSPLLVGVLLFTTSSYYIKWVFPQMGKGDFVYAAFNFIKSANCWLCILVIVSLAKKFLNRNMDFLPLLNESVYPVYILHQTIIICLGYFIVRQNWSIGTKFSLITVFTVFLCWVLFLLLRLNKFSRLLLGIPNQSRFKGLQQNCKVPNR